MQNYNEISVIVPDRLYLTNFEGATNVNDVMNLKIDIIVSILHFNPFAKSFPKQYTGIKLVYFHAEDEDNFHISSYFDKFCDLMISNPTKRVLVHCLAGASRSASLVASYLIKNLVDTKTIKVIKKFNVERIIASLKKKRQCVSPNDGFIKELNEFMKNLVDKKESILIEKKNHDNFIKFINLMVVRASNDDQ